MDYNEKFIKALTKKINVPYKQIEVLYKESGLSKHSEVRSLFMDNLELSYGYANTLTHIVMGSDGSSLAKGKDFEEVLREMYQGKKAHFRPIHDLIMQRLECIGAFEIAPKKGYLSLRAKKQFAMIGPKTNTRMEIGLNLKGIDGSVRLIEQKKGSMCKFIVKLSTLEEVDDELIDWIIEAYKQGVS